METGSDVSPEALPAAAAVITATATVGATDGDGPVGDLTDGITATEARGEVLVRKQRLAGNSATSALSRLGALLIGVGLTPFIIDRIGLDAYGVWTLVAGLGNYLSLLAPGLTNIATRFVAKAHTEGDELTGSRVIGFGVGGWLAIGLAVAPLAAVGLPFLGSHLRTTHNLTSIGGSVLLAGYAYFFLSSAESAFSNQLVGIGDLWLVSIIDLGSRVVYGIVTVILILGGHGVWSLVIASFIALGVQTLAIAVASKVRRGGVIGNPFRLPRPLLREMLQFGGWLQLTGLASLFVIGTDQVVIVSFVSVRDVALLNLAGSLTNQVGFLPNALLGPITPAATALTVRKNMARLRGLSTSASRLFNLFGVGLGGLIVSFGPVAYRTWLGKSYPLLDIVMIYQVLVFIVDSIMDVPTSVLQGMGRPRLLAMNSVWGGIVNVVLTAALIVPFGLGGVLAATLTAVAVRAAVYIRRYHREIDLPLRAGLWSWLVPLMSAAVLAAGLTRLCLAVLPTSWWHTRGGGVAVMVGLSLLYLLAFTSGLRLLHFVSRPELDQVLGVLPGRLVAATRQPRAKLLIGFLAYPSPVQRPPGVKPRHVAAPDGDASGPAPTASPSADPEAAVPVSAVPEPVGAHGDDSDRIPVGRRRPWVDSSTGSCGGSHAVKVVLATGRIHLPGTLAYVRVDADRCYVSQRAAEADGFTLDRPLRTTRPLL